LLDRFGKVGRSKGGKAEKVKRIEPVPPLRCSQFARPIWSARPAAPRRRPVQEITPRRTA